MTEEQKINPLLDKRKRSLPGVTFRLPSKGEIYDKGVLSDDVEDGEVLVFSMRLREELKMKSLDSIFQGTAVSDTISFCVPQVLNPHELCPTDIDYLLTAIKKQTHGDIFKYKDVCMKIEDLVDRGEILQEQAEKEFEEAERSLNPDKATLDELNERLKVINEEEDTEVENPSTEKEEREFDPVLDNVNNLGDTSKFCEFDVPLSHFINTAKEIDPEVWDEKKRFQFQGFDIELKQITFTALKEISNLRLKDDPSSMSEEEYYEYVNKFSNVNIARRIKVVDNIDDPDLIEEWVDSFGLEERTELFEKISEAFDWGIDFNYTLQCQTCGKVKELDMSYINPLYFFLTY